MEGFGKTLRIWAGKQTARARGWFASLGAHIKEKKREITPRRALAVVVALSLWMGAGRMDSSEVVIETEGEVFGEVHWYEK
jgi:hypothetical protein